MPFHHVKRSGADVKDHAGLNTPEGQQHDQRDLHSVEEEEKEVEEEEEEILMLNIQISLSNGHHEGLHLLHNCCNI